MSDFIGGYDENFENIENILYLYLYNIDYIDICIGFHITSKKHI